jgi:hypothetical protein
VHALRGAHSVRLRDRYGGAEDDKKSHAVGEMYRLTISHCPHGTCALLLVRDDIGVS